MNICGGFIVKEKKRIESIGSDVYEILHTRTGLNVLYVKNDDKNKVFCATFRTPPSDDSGAPHILEHSVLCGSEKYMAKDLFNELMKGSVNTYLNAMTFSDKTMYPVASVNEKDFFNLAGVYLDSVFNPAIREKPEFFAQEGWNYHMRTRRSPVEIHGIVYNEMKGAYAQPERLLIKRIDEALFKGTPYEYDAGGVPRSVPALTHERLVSFYDTYYAPSNCHIYLYGDLDIEKALSLVSDALGERAAKHSPGISFETLFTEETPEITYARYSVSEKKKDGCYFAASFPACGYTDFFTSCALEILNYILTGNDAAPLRAKFRESGLCGDFLSHFRESASRTSVSFVGKNCREGDFPEFRRLLGKTLREIYENGLDSELITAALNKWEFLLNEEDYGERPTGLFYGILAASAWVYGGDVYSALNVKETYARVAAEAREGLFERLLKEYLVENERVRYTILTPEKNLLEVEEAELKARLAAFKRSLSDAELKELAAQTRALDRFRKKPDSKRALRRIPTLAPADVPVDITEYGCEYEENGVFLRHNKAGIDYINLHFDLRCVPDVLVPYCGLLKEILGRTDTASYTADKLINALNASAGGVRYTADALQSTDGYFPRFNIKIKALGKNTETVLTLINEAISPKLEVSAVSKILAETLLKTESSFRASGHTIAVNRALSYMFPSAGFIDSVSGIGFYDEISGKTPEEITDNLNRLVEIIFRRENMFYGAAFDGDAVKKKIGVFEGGLKGVVRAGFGLCEPVPVYASPRQNEGFILDSGVSFNAKAYNLFDACDRYSGKLQVAKAILSLGYLWRELRNRGGAYGCGAGFTRGGCGYFYSYRDPEVQKTYEIFDGCFTELISYTISRNEFERYIINAMKPFEKPLKPHEILDMATSDRLLGITSDMRRTERAEILSTNLPEINSIGETLSRLAGRGCLCTLGNKSKVAQGNVFADTRLLAQSKA